MVITLIAPTEDLLQYDLPTLVGIGPRILASCLKNEGWEVQLIFLPKRMGEIYEEQVLEQVAVLSSKSHLVGISLLTDDLANAVQLTSYLKARLDVPILWGGVHPSARPRESLEYADMVCIGEGEIPLVELVGRIEEGNLYTDIPSLWLKREGTIIENPLEPLLLDLDTVPFPDLGPDDHFVLLNGTVQPMTEELLRKRLGRFYFTLSSRGCPFQCTYCFNHGYRRMFPGKKPIRKRSVENVIQELSSVVKRFPYTERICLDDDAFFLRDISEIQEFSMKYRDRVGVPLWIAGAGPTMVRTDKLAALTEAGMTSMRMGIQTGSEPIKRLYRRNFSNKRILQAARMINDFKGVITEVQYDFIIDNPWETDADVIRSLRLASRLPVPHELRLFPLHFYPGTDLYEKAEREGILSENPEDVWLREHHRFRDVYVNRVFVLAYETSRRGGKIGPLTMYLLTNAVGRRLKLSQLLYFILLWRMQGQLASRVKHLLKEILQDLRRGRIDRIANLARKKLSNEGDGSL